MKNEFEAFEAELDQIINETPERAAAVAELVRQMDEHDRAYQMNLAAVRRAMELTKREVTERDTDLATTLLAYLTAAGVGDAALALTVADNHVQIPLSMASTQ